jgi:hypothetical protein
MIPEKRIVLYQGNAETLVMGFQEQGEEEPFADGAQVSLIARLPGVAEPAIIISCAADGHVLSIPFLREDLIPGNYNYEILEAAGDYDRLRLRGTVRDGTGLEIVPRA